MKKGLLLVLLGASLWATLPLFSRIVYAEGVDAATAASMRAFLAAAIYLVWFLLDGTFQRLKLRDVPFYLMYGLLGIGGTFLCYMTAIEMVSTAMAVILLYTAPAFVIIISRLAYREPVTLEKLLALVCTFTGSALVVRAYDRSSLALNGTGILFGLASGFCYSMTTVLDRFARRKNPARVNAGFMLLFGSLVFLAIRPPWRIPPPTPRLWAAYLGLGVIGSVLAYLMYLKGLETGLDGGIASIAATWEPVLATLLCAIVFRDPLEPLQIAGMAIVVGGITLPVIWRARRLSGPLQRVHRSRQSLMLYTKPSQESEEHVQ